MISLECVSWWHLTLLQVNSPKLLLNAKMSFLISTSWRHSSEFSVRIRITTFETAVNSWRSSQVRLTSVSKVLSDPSPVGTGVPSEFRVEWWTKSSTAKNPRIWVKKSAKSWAKFIFDFFRFLGILKSNEACSSRSRRYWVMKDSFPPKNKVCRYSRFALMATFVNVKFSSKHLLRKEFSVPIRLARKPPLVRMTVFW